MPRARTSPDAQITLGDLIDALSTLPPEQVHAAGVWQGASYRGVYRALALAPTTHITAGAMLAEAQVCVGRSFNGYRGGAHTMTRATPLYIAHPGQYREGGHDVFTRARLDALLADVTDTPATPHATLQGALPELRAMLAEARRMSARLEALMQELDYRDGTVDLPNHAEALADALDALVQDAPTPPPGGTDDAP